MGFLKGFDGFVILFEFFELSFEFGAATVEPLLQIHYFLTHLLHFLLVLRFEFVGLLVDFVPVAFESGLAFLALLLVLPFELTDFFLPTGAVLGLLERLLLLGND